MPPPILTTGAGVFGAPTGGGGGGGNVSVNAIGTYHWYASATSATYTGLTINSGTNTVLVVTVAWDSSSVPTGLSLTWDSTGTPQALSRIVTSTVASASGTDIWGLVAPHTGNKTLSMSWTTAAPVFVCASAFDNVDQTGGNVSFENSGASTASTTITLASHPTDIGVGVGTTGGSIGTVLGTTIYNDSVSGTVINSFSDYATGSTSTVIVGSASTNNISAVNLKQFGRAAQNSLAFKSKLTPPTKVSSGTPLATGFATSISDNNRAILAFVIFADSNAGTVSGVNLNWTYQTGLTQALTMLGGPINNGSTIGDIYIFGLAAPFTGPVASLTPSWTGGGTATIYAYYLTGADQTGGSTTFTNLTTNTGSGSLASVTSTVPSFGMSFAVFMGSTNFTAVVSGTDGGHENTSATWADASSYQSGSGSQTLSYGPSSNNFVATSICVKSS